MDKDIVLSKEDEEFLDSLFMDVKHGKLLLNLKKARHEALKK